MLKKINIEALYLTIGMMLIKLAIFCVSVLLARFTTLDVYGKFSMVRSSVNLLETTLSSSINPLIIKSSGEKYGTDKYSAINFAIFLLSLSFALLCGIPVFIASEKVSFFLLGEVNELIVYFAVILFISTYISGVLSSLLVSRGATSAIALAGVISVLVVLPLSYYFVKVHLMIGAIIGMILLYLLDVVVKIFASLYKGVFRQSTFKVIKDGVLDALSYSKSAVVVIAASLINAVSFWWARIILVDNSEGYEQLAQFDVGFQYLAIQMMLLNNITTIFLGKITRIGATEDGERKRLFFSVQRLSFFVSFGFCLITIVLSQPLVSLYGADYDPGVLRSLSIVLIFYSLAIVYNRYCVANGQFRVLLLVSLLSSFFMIIYTFAFASNAISLSVAFSIYYLCSILIYCLFFLKNKYLSLNMVKQNPSLESDVAK